MRLPNIKSFAYLWASPLDARQAVPDRQPLGRRTGQIERPSGHVGTAVDHARRERPAAAPQLDPSAAGQRPVGHSLLAVLEGSAAGERVPGGAVGRDERVVPGPVVTRGADDEAGREREDRDDRDGGPPARDDLAVP